jgi:hypothetical protein|tara:strand:+ start:141 stop:530 length:390 start_codon:yes stop_codon:yes gene_type:complete
MLIHRYKETMLRNADDVVYAIDIGVELYKVPLTTKEVLVKEYSTDSEPTVTKNRIDWDNSNKLGSETVQFLIPTNKQTNTHPVNSGEIVTDYEGLLSEWRELYQEDSDIIRIESELREKFKSNDGYVTT